MRSTPFTWSLAAGTICSLAALMIQLVSPPPAAGDPSLLPSARPASSSDSIDFPVASVTETSPAIPAPTPAVLTIADTAGIALADLSPEGSAAGVAAPRPALSTAVDASLEPAADLETDLLDALNGARFAHGLDGLIRYDYLDAVALARAESLAANGYFDHTAPDGSSAFSELADRGILYRLAGENLARNNYPGTQTVDAAFKGLMASPGHRQNILEPAFGAIGLAVVQSDGMWYHVMVFTNPR